MITVMAIDDIVVGSHFDSNEPVGLALVSTIKNCTKLRFLAPIAVDGAE